MNFLIKTMLILIAYCISDALAQEDALTIVTDSWPPYIIVENDEVSGTDVDITRAVFKNMNRPISIVVMPWKRCVESIKQQKADAILGISLSEERKSFLHYPNSPISTGTTVFFTRQDPDFSFINLNQLKDKRAGAILGYSYCDELDKADLLKRAERVSSLEQNFNKLLRHRLDLVVEVDSVGLSTAQKMGISKQISILENARFCVGGNYLAFSKKQGLGKVAAQFNAALEAFKLTEDYRHILQQYGTSVSEPNGVE